MPQETLRPVRAKGIVHKQIADVAKGLAEEHYEQLARDNAFYAAFPKPRPFVRKNWRLYIDMARQILVHMLGDPNYPDSMKRDIHRALMLDGAHNPRPMAEPAKRPVFALTKEGFQ